MERTRRCLVMAIVAVMATAVPAIAQVPPLIRYQGTVIDANNVPIEGTYTLTFRLYNAQTGGAAVWTETQSGVPVSRGVFNVLLGQTASLTLPFDKDYWLSTQVGTDAEMSPRQRLTSVPYSYRAGVADQLTPKPPGFEVDTGGTLTEGLIAYWNLEEAGGTRDDQKGPYDLTDNNTVTQAAGKKGSASQFTRANSEYLRIVDNAALSTGDIDFTIAAWVYLDSKPGTHMVIASKDNVNGSGTREWILMWDADVNRLRLSLLDASANDDNVFANAFGAVSTATWYFVVAWSDAAANTLNIQVNNGTVDSKSTAIVGNDSTAAFKIGAIGTSGSPSNFWDGRIDEVGFWKKVLTAQERADLYNTGVGTTYSLGKAASPWTQADAGIAYTEGRIGIGTLTIPNILSVQQGSPTDPIADSWTVYPSDRQHKQIIRTVNPHGYLTQLKAVELYEWTRVPLVSDGEAKQALHKSRPTAEELQTKKRDLAQMKARLPKFTAKRVGVAIDDANIPQEILTFNADGTTGGIDLLAYVGYLHAALKEAALKLAELESRLPRQSGR